MPIQLKLLDPSATQPSQKDINADLEKQDVKARISISGSTITVTGDGNDLVKAMGRLQTKWDIVKA